MVIDSSALLAIVFKEPEAGAFLFTIARAEARLVSAANLFEAAINADNRGPTFGQALDDLVQALHLEVIAVDAAQAKLAREAYRRFGKGRHPAGLNFGDCFAYALSVDRDEPLLFKGDDFAKTDVQVA